MLRRIGRAKRIVRLAIFHVASVYGRRKNGVYRNHGGAAGQKSTWRAGHKVVGSIPVGQQPTVISCHEDGQNPLCQQHMRRETITRGWGILGANKRRWRPSRWAKQPRQTIVPGSQKTGAVSLCLQTIKKTQTLDRGNLAKGARQGRKSSRNPPIHRNFNSHRMARPRVKSYNTSVIQVFEEPLLAQKTPAFSFVRLVYNRTGRESNTSLYGHLRKGK